MGHFLAELVEDMADALEMHVLFVDTSGVSGALVARSLKAEITRIDRCKRVPRAFLVDSGVARGGCIALSGGRLVVVPPRPRFVGPVGPPARFQSWTRESSAHQVLS